MTSQLLASFGISDRIQWNFEQMSVLRENYEQNAYPLHAEKKYLAARLGNCTVKQVNN